MTGQPCRHGWEALSGDPLPTLLGEGAGLRWRALVDLVKRPGDSPAVSRARSMANAEQPVSTLLEELLPSGEWSGAGLHPWQHPGGFGWRLVAASQLGADPSDPRLQAAWSRLLRLETGDGGFAPAGEKPSPVVTARAVAALTPLGYLAEPRAVEAAAWLEEVAWDGNAGSPAVTAAAVLAAGPELTAARRGLVERAVETLLDELGAASASLSLEGLSWPNLLRTDVAEVLGSLARASVKYDGRMRKGLVELQARQGEGGLWTADEVEALPRGVERREMGFWVTLSAVCALLSYAVEAGLPRVYPQPPAKG